MCGTAYRNRTCRCGTELSGIWHGRCCPADGCMWRRTWNLVWLFHLTTDENYCMQMAKNYMVDYLENVCLHKYEKANQKERTGRRDSVIKKDETNDTKEEKAEKEDKTEQEEKEESVPVSGSGVVQMQRESRRKERVKENARTRKSIGAACRYRRE